MFAKTYQGWVMVFMLMLAPLMCGKVTAQTITATLNGTVLDASAAAVPGASVTLVNEGTGETRRADTNESGVFVFPSLQPGIYRVKVEKQGFRAVEEQGIVLTANQRLTLGNIELSVGEVTETVNVLGQGEVVNLSSSEHSGLLSSQQLDLMIARGRDVMNVLKVMPGVNQITSLPWGEQVETDAGAGSQSLGGQFGTLSPNIQGLRSWMNGLTLDGQAGGDTDWVGLWNEIVSIDAVSEVKAVLTNYQAEYGRTGGAQINVISKSGTRDFHGGAYWFKRHENLNANDFINNKFGLPKSIYRFSNFGFTFGGPFYIPDKFNANKEKVFFFYSQEHWQVKLPSALFRSTLPTQLERQGDFSQTLDVAGNLVPIIDPLTGQQFQGNRIPPGRINPNGQALLNVFPQPNSLDRAVTNGVYNFEWRDTVEQPKLQMLLKVDLLPTRNNRLTLRLRHWDTDTRGFTQWNGWANSLLPFVHSHYKFTSDSALLAWTRTFSPVVVNELNLAFRGVKELRSPRTPTEYDPALRQNVGYTLGQFYPGANPYGFIPEALFGGVQSNPSLVTDGRIGNDGGDQRYQLTDNLSWNRGSHTFKFGFYFERQSNSEGDRIHPSGSRSGRFDFSRDPFNPLDTNWAFSNALVGNFLSYVESTRSSLHKGKADIVEWFAQDTWKVTSRLTFDYGVRFSWYTPWEVSGGAGGSSWVLDRYDPANVPLFYQPALDSTGNRVAQDPATGQLYPAVFIGGFVPGSGDPVNGMVRFDDGSYPEGFRDNPSIQLGPRFGFAYDPTGAGKTAIRGAFGVTKQPVSAAGSFLWETTMNPPIQFAPQIFYGSMDTLLSSQGVLFPSSVSSIERENLTPTVYNWNFGIQHELFSNTVLDVAYVGNTARHLLQSQDLNTLPYGARFDPANQDPTTGGALPDNFFRTYPGFGSINYTENSGTSNYNALQASLNRRFGRGVQFAVAYTWSKAMGLTAGDGDGLPRYRPRRIWLYGPLPYDQSHQLSINYLWDLPKASAKWQNPVARHVLDNWHLSGITTFATGTPQSIGFGTTDNADITGGGDGVRVNVVGPAELSRGERSFDRWFNTTAFARPAQGDFGNAPRAVFRGPGINNWDFTLMKNFPLKSEQRFIQFRWELYNAFNHTQFQFVDNFAFFDPAGQQVNGRFGEVTTVRPPRIMQFSLRFQF